MEKRFNKRRGRAVTEGSNFVTVAVAPLRNTAEVVDTVADPALTAVTSANASRLRAAASS